MSRNVDWSGLRVLCGPDDPAIAAEAPSLRPFDERTTALLTALSAKLNRSPLPDVATFAFFCRKASLTRLAEPYAADTDRLGRGLVFHIAPSNVPINFAYSLVAALLAGNASIVKASSRDFEQVRAVCAALRELLDGRGPPQVGAGRVPLRAR